MLGFFPPNLFFFFLTLHPLFYFLVLYVLIFRGHLPFPDPQSTGFGWAGVGVRPGFVQSVGHHRAYHGAQTPCCSGPITPWSYCLPFSPSRPELPLSLCACCPLACPDCSTPESQLACPVLHSGLCSHVTSQRHFSCSSSLRASLVLSVIWANTPPVLCKHLWVRLPFLPPNEVQLRMLPLFRLLQCVFSLRDARCLDSTSGRSHVPIVQVRVAPLT